tara:strand:+ start:1182 stop:1373 length:192 start_codon:yes stop_codon:yes gene_type:complete
MEIYIIVVLLIGYVFLLREHVHILNKLEFYREKSVELNGLLRMTPYFHKAIELDENLDSEIDW